MPKPMKVAVLMGGRNSEHEVSLSSGRVIIDHLDPSQYQVKPVKIDQDGAWCTPPGYPGKSALETLHADGREWRMRPGPSLGRLEEEEVQVVIIALHGSYGEDGTIQGMLEMAGIPYTGAGVLGSAMAMDKLLAKQMMVGAGIPTPRFRKIELGRWRRSPQAICIQIADVIGFPCVLKQPQMGSSTGMGMVSDIAQLQILADRLFESAEVLLAESYMGGRELTCGVLARVGDGGLQVLPVTEIKPRSADFFDYDAKYLPGACEEITPAPLAEHQRVRVQATALRVHKLLRCGPLSRTDMILGHDGATYVLEANTLPGMTPTSLVPQAARVAGISFAQLLERLIALALEDAPPKVGVPRWATRRLQREGKAAAGQ